MNDELLQNLMESLDPARELSDATLDELVPHDQLLAKIAAGVASEQLESRRAKPIPIWRRVPTLIGTSAVAIALAVAGATTLLNSSPTLVQGTSTGTKTVTRGGVSGATIAGLHFVARKCKPSNINEWGAGQGYHHVATKNFKLEIVYTNTGKTCYLPITYVGFQPVSGANHSPVGPGSTTPAVLVDGKIVLQHEEAADALLTIDSTTSKQFLQLKKLHGDTCAPKIRQRRRGARFVQRMADTVFRIR